MTSTTRPRTDLSSLPPRTTQRQDLVTVLVSLWLIAGLFVDAYAHSNLELDETFFTPWHGIFYSGFLATAAWMVWLVLVNRGPGTSYVEWIPAGYGLGLVGLAVFVLGGVGDGIWHSVLGVEEGIDALLSPTHLVLFSGGLLIVSSPIRARLRDDAFHPSGFTEFLIPLLSLTLTVALVGFFFSYLWNLGDDGLPRHVFDPVTGVGVIYVRAGIGGIMVTTLILVTPLVLLLRRWVVPFGTFTFMYTAINVANVYAFDLDEIAIAGGIVAGVGADVLILALRAGPARVNAVRVVASVVPLLLWSVYFGLVAAQPGGIDWPLEIWSGAIFFAGLAGFALSLVMIDEPLRLEFRRR